MLTGAIDIAVGNRISGWVFFTKDPRRRAVVVYRTPNGEAFETVADIYRADLDDAAIGDGCYGFAIVLPERHAIGSHTGRIEVEIRGTGEKIVYRTKSDIVAGAYVPGLSKPVSGDIERVENGDIIGWLAGARSGGILPMITVDGLPVMRMDYPVPRPDLNEALKFAGDFGFVCHAGALRAGARIELHAVMGAARTLVARHRAVVPHVETSFVNQLHAAREIAARPGAVAIACWEGSHNPIGRAIVLHDVVRTRRPTLVAAYLFEEFGGSIWPPMLSTETALLTIPWTGRDLYHRAMQNAGIAFETVIICKPRYPGFELAARLAAPEARLILDLDDNEDHFSRSEGARTKPYGLATINLARRLAADIPARTAASATLVEDFGAELLRHARAPQLSRTVRANDTGNLVKVGAAGESGLLGRLLGRGPKVDKGAARVARYDAGPTIGFVGTVRPHKHLLEAARAVQIFNWTTGMEAVLHIYGDVQPKSHADELVGARVVVRQTVPMAELREHLARMDVILTGFPGTGAADDAVTRYQISAKVGDALAMGLPVLVPRSPSVEDLEGISGVFLFDDMNFGEKLLAALGHRGEITLPREFTLEGAYAAFAAAEAKAEAAPRARKVFSGMVPVAQEVTGARRPTLLLVWKQHDAQIFGRRVDQIARTYRRALPNHRVVIVELLHNDNLKAYREMRGVFQSDRRLVLDRMDDKARGSVDADGVEVIQISFSASAVLLKQFERFMLDEGMLPDNTVVVLFPVIQAFDRIAEVLAAYPKIMDVVDNHVTTATRADRQNAAMAQYLAMARLCDRIVFNAERNREWFAALDLLPEGAAVEVVPNWYALPADFEVSDAAKRSAGAAADVIYSGNMNNRIDWALLKRLAGSSGDIRLHLVGAAVGGGAEFEAILQYPNVIYHGPLAEADTLRLLERMDLAIMPHAVDEVSTYMNPLKVHMYAAVGIPVVATDVPGVVATEMLTVAATTEAFISAVQSGLAALPPRQPAVGGSEDAARYVGLIATLRAEGVARGPRGRAV